MKILIVGGAGLVAVIIGVPAVVFVKQKRVRSAILVLTSLAFLVVALETGSFLWTAVPKLWGYTTDKHYTTKGKLTYPDDVLGYAPYADNTTIESSHIGDEPVYIETVYEFDAKARRVVPLERPAERHALFFGGSWTFGEGLANPESLSGRFQHHAKGEFQAYNYAFKGYGPNQMLCLLQDDAKFDDIPQKDGVAVYGFIVNHIWRTVGAPWQLISRDTIPLVRLDAEGQVEGPLYYKDIPSFQRKLAMYKALRTYSAMGRLLFSGKQLLLVSREKSIETTAATIIECSRRYKARFNGEFYTIIWPRRRLQPDEEKTFIQLLEAGGVKVLMPPPYPNPDEAMMHPVDEHPSPKEADWIAQYVQQHIAGVALSDSGDSQ